MPDYNGSGDPACKQRLNGLTLERLSLPVGAGLVSR
jgi:hypothetical protein